MGAGHAGHGQTLLKCPAGTVRAGQAGQSTRTGHLSIEMSGLSGRVRQLVRSQVSRGGRKGQPPAKRTRKSE
jgi:hypothetical protein